MAKIVHQLLIGFLWACVALNLLLASPMHGASITQISNDPYFQQNTLTGSITGGTRIFIKGSGFDEREFQNEVFVGPYPCIIDYYFSNEYVLACDMPRGFYREHKNLVVTVRVRGVAVTCEYGDCKLNLEMRYTPLLYSIDPQAVFAGDHVNIRGVWRANNVSDVKSVYISGRNCLLTETQLEEATLSFWNYTSMNCKVPQDMENGDHTLSITSAKGTGFDHPHREAFGFKVGTETKKYNIRVHPKIDSVSANSGYLNGQKLEMRGRGFGQDIEKVKVSLEDLDCRVLELETVIETREDEEGNLFEESYDRMVCELAVAQAPFTNKLFKGGAGFRNQLYSGYNRYLSSMLGPKIERELIWDKTLLSLENQLNRDYYVQKLWGVLRSREKGTYTFKLAGDDQCKLMISKDPIDYTQPFDETTMLDTHCQINGWTSMREWYRESGQFCDVELEADTDYYMVVLQTEGGGGDHLTVAMITPNSDTSLPNQKPQVQKVEIVNSPVRHEMRVKVMNAIGGTFTLTFMERNADSGKVTYLKETAKLGNDVSAETMAERIRQKVGTRSTCVREALDDAGNVIEDLTQAKGFQWTVSFTSYRSRPLIPLVNKEDLIGEGISVEAVEMTPQSAPVRGKFKLRYGDCVTSDIHYHYNQWNVRDRFQACDVLSAGVTVYTQGNRDDGTSWHIVMDSVTGKGLDIQVEENNLTGGAGDAPPQIKITPDFEPAVPALVYLPVPSEFLRTASPSPQLNLEVDGLLAGCDADDCVYTFAEKQDTPIVTQYTLTGTTLTITMGELSTQTTETTESPDTSNTGSSPQERLLQADPGVNLENIGVRFGNVDCKVTQVAWPTVTCTMPTNSDNSLQIEAGSFVPMVHLDGKGYFSVDAAVTPHVVPLQVDSVSPAEGSLGGGTMITILGQGFAANSKYRNSNTITVNDLPCVVSEFNTNRVVCETPEKKDNLTTTTLKIVTNGLESTSDKFAYNEAITPKIHSLSPNSSSPMLKNDLVIQGENFGSDLSLFRVWLKPRVEDGKEYECNPTQAQTGEITCRLSGGKKGEYDIKVHKKGVGYSIPKQEGNQHFMYETSVTSILPTSGSTEGGTVLTIQGTNFSPVELENQVVIGDSGLDYCVIESATQTEIKCRVNKPKEKLAGEQDVYVLAQIQVEADCPGKCKFTFDEAMTPTVTSIEPLEVIKGNTVTINGTGFTETAENIEVTLGETKITNLVKVSDTKLTFEMPEMKFGSHEPKILVGNKGYARYESAMLLSNEFRLTSMSPTQGSQFGSILTLSGNGFNPDDTRITINNKDCVIKSISFTEIVCHMNSVSKNNKDYRMTLLHRDMNEIEQEATCESCVYRSNNLYPWIRSVSTQGPYDPALTEIVVDGDRMKSQTQDGDPYELANVRAWLRSDDNDGRERFSVEGNVEFVVAGVKLSFSNIPAGKYRVVYHVEGYGFARVENVASEIEVGLTVSNSPSVTSSLAGGALLTLTGKGFPENDNKEFAKVTVCGTKCNIVSTKHTELVCSTPVLNTQEVQDQLKLLSPQHLKNVTIEGEHSHQNMYRTMDGDLDNYYHGRSSTIMQFDYGESVIVRATEIRLIPRLKSDEKWLSGGRFEGSLDGVDFKVLATVTDRVVEGINRFKPNDTDSEVWEFRYLRFLGTKGDYQISEIEVMGYEFLTQTNINIDNHACDVAVEVGGVAIDQDLAGAVVYRQDQTPEVTGIAPEMGTTVGGTQITISGKNFQSDSVVTIDDVVCANPQVTSTQITCTTGNRPTFRESTFEISSATAGLAATKGHKYLYIDRWSDPLVWGGETPPREGDSIHVPKGQILLVDVSPPPLYTILVEGTLMFADEKELELEAWFIIVREGTLTIGTPEKPHLNKLTITLHGTRESKMLPVFGNKGIMVHNGTIDIHGRPLAKTWGLLESGVSPGADRVTLTEEVDWEVGSQIIVTPTGRSRAEVEERVIVKREGKTLILDKPLEHYHFAGEIDPNKNHGRVTESPEINTIDPPGRDQPFFIRGEVALLSRNVLIRGDETTKTTGHGVHIMVRGNGISQARFSYFEVFLAGQKFQLGRYPLHYHMMGEVHGMYIKGCAVHHTFNRGTTIHGTDYLLLEHNVYYRTMGHTIFLEDGIEKNNVIQHNIVVHVSPSTSMLMSDTDPAGLWQARPSNYIRDNHFVASAGNGAWFELVAGPTGPSAVFGRGICSSGDHLVQYDRNVHHTNGLGLRVYPIYIPKTNPCVGPFNGRLRDPYSENPGMPAHFNNNIYYMNGLGSFGKKIGAVTYVDNIWVSNGTNQQISEPNNAKDSMPRNEGGMSIGFSELTLFHVNADGNPRFGTGKALSFGRKSGFMVKDTRFYNFPNGTFSTYCGSCFNEKKRVPGGVRQNFLNVQFKNFSALRIGFADALYFKSMVYDKDGSLMRVMGLPEDIKDDYINGGGWITSWFPHLDIPECWKQTDPQICNAPCAICTNKIRLKTLKHTVIDNAHLMYGQDMKLFNLGSYQSTEDKPDFNFDMNLTAETSPDGIADDDKFGFNKFRNCQLSMGWRGWLSVIATGYRYNYHFGRGVEWKKMKTENDYYWGLEGPELPVYFRHNHTEHRELYDSVFWGVDENDDYKDWKNRVEDVSVDGVAVKLTDSDVFGKYHYDPAQETITWKVDEKRRGAVQSEAIYCRYQCPEEEVPEDTDTIEPVRLWSQLASWEGRDSLPQKGEVIEIKRNWNMHVDIKTPQLKHLKILGRLTFAPDVDDVEIHANLIEIKFGGKLLAGTKDKPHTRNARIVIYGKKSDDDLVITADIAPVNKAIVNKGELHLYGSPPKRKWARLQKKIDVGDRHFYLDDKDHGWKAGDQLVVASSTTQEAERELVTIDSVVDGTHEIKIKEEFKFLHYGSTDLVSTSQGDLDMRAEVGNLTRNLVIEANNDDGDEWGCTILTPNFPLLDQGGELQQGNLQLDGVEIRQCGQRDHKKAAVDLNWVKKARGMHSITNSSFNDCQGWALNMYRAEGLTFSYNVIYNARKYGIFLQEIKSVVIEHNLLVGIKIRENYDNREYWDMYIGIYYNDTSTHLDASVEDEIVIRHNSVSSAPWFGYAVPGYNCNDKITPGEVNFYNNTAHSCKGGWIPTKLDRYENDCVQFSYFNSYKNDEQGFVQRAEAKNIVVNNFILADNRNGLVINGGNGADYPTVTLRDSVIIGKALGDCHECYDSASECETTGVITSLFNKHPYDFYFEQTRMPLHNSTNVHFSFGGRQTIERVDVINFNDEYPCAQPSTAIRMNNFYQDNANFITMRQMKLENVIDQNLFYFPNHKRHLDTPAYCGKRDCTGNYNVLFYDEDGSVFGDGKPMQFFGNNKGAGRDGDCTFFSEWNGHACNPEYAQMLLTWRGDERGLVIFPLMLKIEDYAEDKGDDLKFYHETDSPRQVTSLIKRFKTTRVTTSQTMPSGLTYQLFTQNSTDWVVIKVQSENPATMTVWRQDPLNPKSEKERVEPILLEVDEDLDMAKYKDSCGANYYRASDRMLWFVVRGDNCKITVEYANSLQLSTRLNIDPKTFWDSGGVADFKQKLMALLEIPAERIRIVGIRRGSTIVDTVILSKKNVEEERTEKETVKTEFKSFLEKFETAVQNEEVDFGAPVLEIKNEMAIDNVEPVDESPPETTDPVDGSPETETDPKDDSSNNNTRNILIGVLVPLGLIIVVIGGWVAYKCCAKKKIPQPPQESRSGFDLTKDMTLQRSNNVEIYTANNNQRKKFGGPANIRVARQMSLNPESKLDSYIRRKN